jgi:calcineurin-like phosphoesterase family protein
MEHGVKLKLRHKNMHNVFLIGDPHLSHDGVCKFLRDDGSKLRPWDNAVEMDETMIQNWNSVVKQFDKVYVVGDLVMKAKKQISIMERLNGRKVLIKGNHDIGELKVYLPYFYDIRAFHILDKFAITHIPIHPNCLGRFRGNIHAHTHQRSMKKVYDSTPRFYMTTEEEDPRYFCVSAEQINYTPIEWNDLRKKAYAKLGLEIKNS